MLALLFPWLNDAEPNPPPNPDAIELLGGGPGKPRKERKEYAKDSYMARLLGRPLDAWPEDFEPAPEVIEAIEEAVKAPQPVDAFAAEAEMRRLGLAYQEAYAKAYAEIYLQLLAKRQAADDEEIMKAIALLL